MSRDGSQERIGRKQSLATWRSKSISREISRIRAMSETPKRIGDFITEIRTGLVCARCGKYIGSLAPRRYLPPPYPVALEPISSDDEVDALIGFEWHMLGLLREGRFVIQHPERDGHCITFREWMESDDEEDANDDADDDVDPEARESS